MDKALKELLDKQAIGELIHNYSRAVDRKDWALLRDLYTHDGIDDHAALFCGPADDFVKWLERATAHLDGMACPSSGDLRQAGAFGSGGFPAPAG